MASDSADPRVIARVPGPLEGGRPRGAPLLEYSSLPPSAAATQWMTPCKRNSSQSHEEIGGRRGRERGGPLAASGHGPWNRGIPPGAAQFLQIRDRFNHLVSKPRMRRL